MFDRQLLGRRYQYADNKNYGPPVPYALAITRICSGRMASKVRETGDEQLQMQSLGYEMQDFIDNTAC